ncbi:MAG TPA: ATP-binding protein [Symbiobacteriaceae bacterium]|nr:ATP-binding protein [Symbiobacteriaceae bacterium]
MDSRYERTSRLVLLVAFIELGLGLGLSIWPQEFQPLASGPGWSYQAILSVGLLAGGGVLLERGRYRLPFWLQAVLALVPAAPLVVPAVVSGREGLWVGMFLYGLMALAVMCEPWVHRLAWPRVSGPQPDPAALILAAVMLLSAVGFVLRPAGPDHPVLGVLSPVFPIHIAFGFLGAICQVPFALGIVWAERYRWLLRPLALVFPLTLVAVHSVAGYWTTAVSFSIWCLTTLSGWRPQGASHRHPAPGGHRTEPVELAGEILPGVIHRLEAWAPAMALCISAVSATAVHAETASPVANLGIAAIIGYTFLVRWIAPEAGTPLQRAFWHVAILTVIGGVLFASRSAVGQSIAALLVVVPALSARALGPLASRRLLYLLLAVVVFGETSHFMQGTETWEVSLNQALLELVAVVVASGIALASAREQWGLVRKLEEANGKLSDGHAELAEAHMELQAQQEELTAQHEELLATNEALSAQQETLAAQNVQLMEQREALQRQQAELERLSQRLELILNAAGDGICGVDLNGRTTFVNPAAAHILGYEIPELTGQSVHTIFGDRAEFVCGQCPVCVVALDGVALGARESLFWRRDGSAVPVEYTATPVEESGNVVGAVITFRDITERRAVDQMKREFVSVVSHELRTPLTSIRGSLGLLASGALGELGPKARRMVEIAATNSDRLVRLINDILDIERMESGTVQMEIQECDAAAIMTQAVEFLQAIAAKAAVSLEVEPLRARIQADPDRISQTLTNLLSNAIKFSPAGSTVSLTARRQDDHYLFEVADQGRGIPSDQLESIFERFRQVDASDSRQKGGTGLGLAICRSIIQQHGGRIWAESEPGKGSRFFFTLPASGAPHPRARIEAAHPAQPAQPARPHVLACLFAPDRVETLRPTLLTRGYQVATAGSSQEALAELRLRRPDAVLVNLDGPHKAGVETIAAIKAAPGAGDLPVIICSSWSAEAGVTEAGSGVDWVADPHNETALVHALERAMVRQSLGAKVLIVEDDPDLASVLLTMFQRHGARTSHARTGSEAIAMTQQAAPDLLVLDLYLPEVDGFAVVDWLRRHGCLSRVPVVVYTARDLSETDRQSLQTGNTVFLTKGRISPAEFEKRIASLLTPFSSQPGGTTGDGKSPAIDC